MSVRIFIPKQYFYIKENCDIYGEIRINDHNAVSYYIIAATKYRCNDIANETAQKHLRHLGHIVHVTELQKYDVAICFAYDQDVPNIFLHKLSILPINAKCVNVFLYQSERMLHMQVYEEDKEVIAADDELGMLYKLLTKYQQDKQLTVDKTNDNTDVINKVFSFPIDLLAHLLRLLMQLPPIESLLKRTVLHEHYQEWSKFKASGQRNVNIITDRALGICLMLLLLLYLPHPDVYLMQASHYVVSKLRLLLNSMRGNPIGLKLNVHLNNFFLDCFLYHVELWDTFLGIIEPFLRLLFVPISCIGCMGLSYQLALLADIVSVIGLHAHCFYIYAAILYKVEINTIGALWKVVLGKRFNVLKNRIESHNYMNRQLYLATIIFTSSLFLFPTILLYYCVFTTLRICIVMLNVFLQLSRRYMLEFPLYTFWQWLKNNFYEIHSLELKHIDHVTSSLLQTNNLPMSVFKINVLSSSLNSVFSCESGVLKDLKTNEYTSVGNIITRLFNGTF